MARPRMPAHPAHGTDAAHPDAPAAAGDCLAQNGAATRQRPRESTDEAGAGGNATRGVERDARPQRRWRSARGGGATHAAHDPRQRADRGRPQAADQAARRAHRGADGSATGRGWQGGAGAAHQRAGRDAGDDRERGRIAGGKFGQRLERLVLRRAFEPQSAQELRRRRRGAGRGMGNDAQDRRRGARDAADYRRRTACDPHRATRGATQGAAGTTEELISVFGGERGGQRGFQGLFVLEAVFVVRVDVAEFVELRGLELVRFIEAFILVGRVELVAFIEFVRRFELVSLVEFIALVEFVELVVRVRGSFGLVVGEIFEHILLVKRHGRSPLGSRRNACSRMARRLLVLTRPRCPGGSTQRASISSHQ